MSDYPERDDDGQIVFGLLLERCMGVMLTLIRQHDEAYGEESYEPRTDPLRVQTEEGLRFTRLATQGMLRTLDVNDCERILEKTQTIWEIVLQKNQQPTDTLSEFQKELFS